jgi:hypothetical protein
MSDKEKLEAKVIKAKVKLQIKPTKKPIDLEVQNNNLTQMRVV